MKQYSLPTVKQNVLTILRNNPKTRDSDNLLIFNYWFNYDDLVDNTKLIDLCLDEVLKLTPASSIFRARQLIQNDPVNPLYPPTDYMKNRRNINEPKVRKFCNESRSIEDQLEL